MLKKMKVESYVCPTPLSLAKNITERWLVLPTQGLFQRKSRKTMNRRIYVVFK